MPSRSPVPGSGMVWSQDASVETSSGVLLCLLKDTPIRCSTSGLMLQLGEISCLFSFFFSRHIFPSSFLFMYVHLDLLYLHHLSYTHLPLYKPHTHAATCQSQPATPRSGRSGGRIPNMWGRACMPLSHDSHVTQQVHNAHVSISTLIWHIFALNSLALRSSCTSLWQRTTYPSTQ